MKGRIGIGADTAAMLIAVSLAGVLGGCSTNTRGAWTCAADRGVPCQSIESLDHRGAVERKAKGNSAAEAAPVVRWWTGAEALTGNFDEAPRREPDQFVKVVIAGWSDAAGDYHAPAEIYAVMRHGGWWAPPPATPLAPPKRVADRATAPAAAPAGGAVEAQPAALGAPAPAATAAAPAPPAVAAKPGQ